MVSPAGLLAHHDDAITALPVALPDGHKIKFRAGNHAGFSAKRGGE